MDLISVVLGILVVGFGVFNLVQYLTNRKERTSSQTKDINLPGRIIFYAVLPILMGVVFIYSGILGISVF